MDIGMCGIAVLDCFSFGISAIFISNCGMRFLKHFRRYYKYSPSPSPFSEPFPVSNCFGYRFKWATLSCYFLVIYSRRNRVMVSA